MIVYSVIAFFLENIYSLLFNNTNTYPLFFLVTLLLVYQKYDILDTKYIIYLIILGLFYDIVYTNIYIDTILFPVLGFLNIIYKKNVNDNILLNGLFIVVALTLYEIMFYGLFCMLSLNEFSILVYLKTLIYVLIPNLIYYIIMKFILRRSR